MHYNNGVIPLTPWEEIIFSGWITESSYALLCERENAHDTLPDRQLKAFCNDSESHFWLSF